MIKWKFLRKGRNNEREEEAEEAKYIEIRGEHSWEALQIWVRIWDGGLRMSASRRQGCLPAAKFGLAIWTLIDPTSLDLPACLPYT